MTCLISSLNKQLPGGVLLLLFIGTVLHGCAGVSQKQRTFPVVADRAAPQMAGTGPISWSVSVPGNVGEFNIIFEVDQDGSPPRRVQSGAETTWNWAPEQAGEYRVRAIVEENMVRPIEGDWSRPYEITSVLTVEQVKTDTSFPQAALSKAIEWSASAEGGVGPLWYGFELEQDGQLLPIVSTTTRKRWEWTPDKPGHYRIRAVVSDRLANQAAGNWSEVFVIAPALTADAPSADQTFPQAAQSTVIAWTVSANGGVGELTVAIELERDRRRLATIATGHSEAWSWRPDLAGSYRVRTVVTDRLDNRIESRWSEPFKITPPLVVERLTADKNSPQAALSGEIVWSVTATGGVGSLEHSFELERNGVLQDTKIANTDSWSWSPEVAGSYRVRAVVTDRLDNTARSTWSEPYEIKPPLLVEGLTADKRFPQAALSGAISWTVNAGGGVGRLSQAFELEKDGQRLPVIPAGLLGVWSWTPEAPGIYRIRAVVTDELGNSAAGEWSEPYRVVAPLTIESLAIDRSSPQAAATVPVTWTVAATGGVGEKIITFELDQKGKKPLIAQVGSEPTWTWAPEHAGEYRVRTLLEDRLGNTVTGAWSDWFEIAPPLTVSGMTADRSFPQAALTEAIAWSAKAKGGVGNLNYAIELEKEGTLLPTLFMKSSGPWLWRPENAGHYRIRAVVTDSLNNQTQGEWSQPFKIAPPLMVGNLTADRSSPQTARGAAIIWTASAGGGVGELSQSIELEKDGQRLALIKTGRPGPWSWTPGEPGIYRMRAVVTDSLGNKAPGPWTEPYAIAPPLTIAELAFDRSNPQAAQSVPITWSVVASGGVGAKTYLFQLSRDREIEQFAQEGPDRYWAWFPETAGRYRIRVVATDSLGNQVDSAWSDEYEIMPALVVSTPEPDHPLSQFLIHSRIVWRVQASGGVGKKKYYFTLEKQGGEKTMIRDYSDNVWVWRPKEPGFYRLRVSAMDALGNQQESDWSEWKEVCPPLSFSALTISSSSPQQALQDAIRCSAKTDGGVGIVTYEFRSSMQGIVSVEQQSPSPQLEWQPRKAGIYRIKVRAWDDENNVVESEWSDEYRITPAVTDSSRVAFLPLINLADVKAPIGQIGRRYSELLQSRLQILPEDDLEEFMQKHRMRYSGGLNAILAQALLEETGVEAVFITALETWAEGTSPRISLISRLVTTGATPQIVWIDSVGLTADDHPGLLGLGRTTSADQLLTMALERLSTSVQDYLDGNDPVYRHVAGQKEVRLINGEHEKADGAPDSIEKKHQPKFTYRASTFEPSGRYRIAVVPFMNINARKHAGEIIALHTVKQLHRYANILVFEPGLIRETLLNYRMIMRSGPSLAAADVLTDAAILGADLVASGKVFDYQGHLGRSKVDFSLQVLDGVRREVLWTSRSSATGNQGVYLFDWGEVPSAHGLTSRMTQALIQQLQEQ